ncbi:MAG TPA: metal ABC transporter permease [Acidiferrobacterales bacterium]
MSAGVEWSILLPAFLAGLLVLSTHVPFGEQVLARGIVFIDLAVAQVAALGVVAASLAGMAPHGLPMQATAVGAALAAALLLAWTERRWPAVQEAIIGVLFVLAASAALLVLSHNPHGGEYLKELLEGQILWVGVAELGAVLAISVPVLAVWWRWRGRLPRLGFYVLFALAVTASVQLVGIYLVFASLIVPPLAARAWPPRRRLAMAYLLGALGYAAGLTLSALADLPAGAVIVVCLVAVGLILAGARRALSAG